MVTRDTKGEQLGRETKISLFLEEDQLEYLEERRIKDLIKKHSEFISYPIHLWTAKTTEKEISDDEDEEVMKEEEEYSMGSAVTTEVDVYSFGILLSEMLTGKRPTDELFRDGMNLHSFVNKALGDQVIAIMVNQPGTERKVFPRKRMILAVNGHMNGSKA